MIDARVHLIFAGITLIQANFSETASVASLVQFVAEQTRKRESMRERHAHHQRRQKQLIRASRMARHITALNAQRP
jgi:predicted amidohydrolase YtcJ